MEATYFAELYADGYRVILLLVHPNGSKSLHNVTTGMSYAEASATAKRLNDAMATA